MQQFLRTKSHSPAVQGIGRYLPLLRRIKRIVRLRITTLATMIAASVLSGQGIGGDFNADRKEDILWRDRTTGTVSLWLLNGGAVQSSVGGWVVGNDWSIQGVADFDGDGKSDILWRNTTTGVVTIWLMNGGTLLKSVGGWTVDTGLGDSRGRRFQWRWQERHRVAE